MFISIVWNNKILKFSMYFLIRINEGRYLLSVLGGGSKSIKENNIKMIILTQNIDKIDIVVVL